MASNRSDESTSVSCNLTLEDEFVLTRIRAKAHSLGGKARDQFFWSTVFRLLCRERAYKRVMEEVGITVDTNIHIFEDEEPELSKD
jgi:hypothetical protein